MKRLAVLGLIAMGVLSFLRIGWADAPKVSVEIDKDQLVLGDSVRLTITVEGTTPNAPPALPPVPDFNVRYLGSRTESFTSFTVVIQGKQTEEHHSGGGTQFEYALIPKRMGTFTIPRLSFMMDGKSYETSEPYIIRVTDVPEGEETLFLKVSVNKETVYLGESILLTFEWYFDKDVQEYSLNIPWFEGLKGFLVEDPKADPSKQYAQLIINDKEKVAAEKKGAVIRGKRYTVLKFQKILTPISAGSYTLDPSFLRAEIVKGYEESRVEHVPFFRYYSNFEDFFNMGRRPVTARVMTRSKPILLSVKPLPEQNRPATFSGAVGSFDFQVTVSPETVKKGEPVTVAMKVVGTGNFNEVQLPDFPELSAFKSYTPEIKTDTSNADGMVIGEKTFTKVLVGRREGKYEIPPIAFSFFDTGEGTYKTISRGPFPIEVQPGAAQEETPQLSAVAPEMKREGKEIKVLGHDIRYIKTDLGERHPRTTPLYQIPLFWFLGFVPLPVMTGIAFLIQKRRTRFQTDVAFARRTQAFKNAQKALAEGREPDLSKILTRFLADKLNRPAGTLPQELLEVLKAKHVESELMSDLKDFFDRIDLVKYSRAEGGTQETDALLGKTKELLNRLEKGSL